MKHVAYQIKADDAGSNMVANVLPTDTPLTQGIGSKGQAIYFSESSHFAYQIKARGQRSNILISQQLRQLSIFFAEILHAGRAAIDMKHIKLDFRLKAWVRVRWVDLGGGAEAKIKIFQNMVMLHIKLKLTTLAATW